MTVLYCGASTEALCKVLLGIFITFYNDYSSHHSGPLSRGVDRSFPPGRSSFLDSIFDLHESLWRGK